MHKPGFSGHCTNEGKDLTKLSRGVMRFWIRFDTLRCEIRDTGFGTRNPYVH
jgi:hypothetical protein